MRLRPASGMTRVTKTFGLTAMAGSNDGRSGRHDADCSGSPAKSHSLAQRNQLEGVQLVLGWEIRRSLGRVTACVKSTPLFLQGVAMSTLPLPATANET